MGFNHVFKFPADNHPQSQQFVIYTGMKGQEFMELIMKKQVMYEAIQNSMQRGKITLAELIRLREMVDSPGDDNLVIVQSVLEFREKENDKTI